MALVKYRSMFVMADILPRPNRRKLKTFVENKICTFSYDKVGFYWAISKFQGSVHFIL